jgi:hypothetical protein
MKLRRPDDVERCHCGDPLCPCRELAASTAMGDGWLHLYPVQGRQGRDEHWQVPVPAFLGWAPDNGGTGYFCPVVSCGRELGISASGVLTLQPAAAPPEEPAHGADA